MTGKCEGKIIGLALAAAAACCGGAQELAPIPLELPKPRFVSTPVPVPKIANLRRPRGRARPPFLAPVGTTNMARGKPVSSSDEFPIIGELEMVADGDKQAGPGSWIELAPGPQWVQIDLGEPCRIHAVVVWHQHDTFRVYHDVVVRVAADADFTRNVRTVFNNDDDNSSGFGPGQDESYVETREGELIDAKGELARYVRLHSNGNTANACNHYVEVEVFGTRGLTPTPR